MTYLHSSVNTPMRDALKQMLRDFPAKYNLNLVFHQRINLEAANKKVKHWHRHMSRRLFGRNFRKLPADQRIEFLLLPERGLANLHYHGLIRLPETHVAFFERIALTRWRHVAFKGTLHFAPLSDPEGWFTYITKGAHAVEFLDSSMVD
ncbi:MAG: hypothetical protein IPH15_08745 [Comamonadaceae bacterium]|nr:hypothetical protein [Comamonadaceae bacterium]